MKWCQPRVRFPSRHISVLLLRSCKIPSCNQPHYGWDTSLTSAHYPFIDIFPIKKTWDFPGFSCARWPWFGLPGIYDELGAASNGTGLGETNGRSMDSNGNGVMEPHGYGTTGYTVLVLCNLDLVSPPLLIRHDLVWQGTQITYTCCFHWASTRLPLGFHSACFRCIRKCNAKSLVLSAVSTQSLRMPGI